MRELDETRESPICWRRAFIEIQRPYAYMKKAASHMLRVRMSEAFATLMRAI
jgi:hypothetical protein